MTLDTTAPSRELDRRVAEILGYPFRKMSNGYLLFIEPSNVTGFTREIPQASDPRPGNEGDKVMLCDALLHLARRGYAVGFENGECFVWGYTEDTHANELLQMIQLPRVPGTDDAAFALCVCRAVVAIGERG